MIYAKRIRFRAPERDDLPKFIEWLNDPEVRQGIAAFLPMSLAREEHWFENMLSRPIEAHPFVIELKQGRKWLTIGTCGFHDIDWISRKAEVGIMIGDKRHWNKGLGTEAMHLLLKHGFETLNLHRIYLKVFTNNPRAIRSYEKAGFVVDGRLREAHFADGAYIDDLLMSVLRPEWQARNQSKKAGSGQ
jgi:RimJ/RimL family protein N-acetyltransferase